MTNQGQKGNVRGSRRTADPWKAVEQIAELLAGKLAWNILALGTIGLSGCGSESPTAPIQLPSSSPITAPASSLQGPTYNPQGPTYNPQGFAQAQRDAIHNATIVRIARQYVSATTTAQKNALTLYYEDRCNCKNWVRTVVSAASKSVVSIPSTYPNWSGGQWSRNESGSKYLRTIASKTGRVITGNIRNVVSGNAIQIDRPHTLIVGDPIVVSRQVVGFYALEANWKSCQYTGDRKVYFSDFEGNAKRDFTAYAIQW